MNGVRSTRSPSGGSTASVARFPDLIASVAQLEERGIGFKSLQESIDTTSSGGRLVFHVFGVLAESNAT